MVEYSVLSATSRSYPSSEGSGDGMEDQRLGELLWTVSSEHDRAITFMNKWQLWLPTQDLLKTKPIKAKWQMGEGLVRPTSSWRAIGKGSQLLFFPEVWSMVGCPCFSGWPYTHVHMGSTNWIQWVIFKKEDMKLGEGYIWGGLRS